MPYQGSAQSIGFRNRAVIDPSRRMREEAQLIKEQGQQRIRGMETQASQQIREMERVSEIQADNARYELQALSKFSKTIDTFMQAVVVEEVKKREERKYYEDVLSYETESPEVFEQAKAEVNDAMQRGTDLHVKIHEEANKAPTPEAQDVVRKVSTQHSRGYQMATLKEAASGFGTHLLTELETNTTQLIDPDTGKPFTIKDATTTTQKELSYKYLKAQYIQNHRGNLSAKVVATTLLPELNNAIGIQRKTDVLRIRRDDATASFDAEENILHQALTSGDADVASKGIQAFLKVAPDYLKILNPTEEANKLSRGYLNNVVETIIKSDPEKVNQLISVLQDTKIDGHPAGAKSLFDLYGDEFSAEKLKTMATQARQAKWQQQQTDQKIQATEVFNATVTAFQQGANDIERLSLIKEFASNFPDQLGMINQLATWEPAVLGVEASEAKVIALQAQYGGEIPKSEVKNLDPSVLQKYQNKIVDQVFGSGDKEAIKDGQKIVTAAIKEVRKITTNDAVMYDDAIRAERAAHGMIMPMAREIYENSKAAGKPISHGEAIRIAAGQVADMIEGAQDDPKNKFYSESGKGFTKFEKEVGSTNIDKNLARQKTDYRKAQNLLKKSPDALINERIISNPADLELGASGLPKPVFYALAKLDPKGRTAFEIFNAQRSKSGLAKATLPKEGEALLNVLDKFPDVKRAYTSYPSYQTINRGLEQIGTVSAANLLKALGFQESGGGNYQAYNADAYGASNPALGKYQILWTTALGWARSAGMSPPASKQAFLNSPQYQERLAQWAINEYVRQASKRTQDPKIAIRMAAAMWYGGAGSIDLYDRTTKETGGRYPSMREYTTSVLNHYMRGS